ASMKARISPGDPGMSDDNGTTTRRHPRPRAPWSWWPCALGLSAHARVLRRAEERRGVLPQDRVALPVLEDCGGRDPADRVVHDHRRRPIRPEEDPIGTDHVEQKPEVTVRIRDRVVQEATDVGARPVT